MQIFIKPHFNLLDMIHLFKIHRKSKFFQHSIGSILLIFFLCSCGQNNGGQGYDQGPPELPIATVERRTVKISKEYTASIEGISNVEIRPQVSGYLSKIYVDEGDYVKAGQLLFKVEDRTLQEQVRSAGASLATAQANLSTAKINLDRKKELVRSKIVTELQVKEAEAAYNAAKGVVSQAASAVESSRINVNFSTIKAPVSGFIGRFNYRLGSLLSPTNTEPIVLLSDIREVYAYFGMSENDFIDFQTAYAGSTIEEKLRNAPPVSLTISNGNTYDLTGKIDAVAGQFSNSTGSISLRAKFNNPKLSLRSGNTGKIILEQSYQNATLVPVASTKTIQDKVFAYSLDKNNKVVQLPIQVAGKSGPDYIVSGGIKSGDRYIVSGFERLQPGDDVQEQKKQSNAKKAH